MKNSGLHPVIFATILFAVLLTGFLLGRLSPLHGNTLHTGPDTAASSKEPAVSETNSGTGKININTATADELTLLPGIGTTLAERIVAYRQTHGPFTSIDELVNVKGIGTETLSRLSQFITVGG